MTPPVWIPDHSALACFRENPEAFRLKYRLNLVTPSPATYYGAGHALHAARNVLFDWRVKHATVPRTVCPGEQPCRYPACECAMSYMPADTYPADVVERAVEAARTHRGDTPGRRGADQCEAVVRAYAERYATEPFRVLETEQYAEAMIHLPNCVPGSGCSAEVGCFMYCGILDGVIEFPDASVYIDDLKSTGAYLNGEWETAMSLSDQFVGYVALRRALGLRCDGFYVDGVRFNDYVPKPKPGQTAPSVPKVDPEKDFVRTGPYRVPEWRIERWARDVQYDLARIAELERTRGLDTPWPLYQNWAYGKVDEYRDFYEQPSELHSQTMQLFERRVWNPREIAEGRKVMP